MENQALTTALRGHKVLAKNTQYGVSPFTFANRTQANNAAAKVGGEVFRFVGGRPFYVEVK